MNNLRAFNFQGKKVRTLAEKDETWFVANDVCEAISIQRTQTRRLADDERGVRSMHTLGGKQEFVVVNEFGLYNLILGSRKPEAKAFKRWVTHEVLPSIRKTGSYILPKVLVSPPPYNSLQKTFEWAKKMLTDTPQNPKIQEKLDAVNRLMITTQELLHLYNRHNEECKHNAYDETLRTLASDLTISIIHLLRVKPNMTETYI